MKYPTWAAVKTLRKSDTARVNVAALEALGGTRSKKNGEDRVYFSLDTLAGLWGLQYELYKTGNVTKASVRGVSISNGQATRLIDDLADIKLYWDVRECRFYRYDTNHTMALVLISLILRALLHIAKATHAGA